MQRLTRLFGGALFGAALLTAGIVTFPQTARADEGGFCDETENYICCCTVDEHNNIRMCSCSTKPAE